MAHRLHHPAQRLYLPHLAHHPRCPHRPVSLAWLRRPDDTAPETPANGAVRSRRRPANSPEKSRHTDNGRRAHHPQRLHRHAALGGPAHQIHLDRPLRHARLRRGRLDRRLPQTHPQRPARPARQTQIRPALARLLPHRRLALPERCQPGRNHPHRPLPQRPQLEHGLDLHPLRLLRPHRCEQRRQPHRRPRRPRHHARRPRCRRPCCLRLHLR